MMKCCKVGCMALEIDRIVNQRVKCSVIYLVGPAMTRANAERDIMIHDTAFYSLI